MSWSSAARSLRDWGRRHPDFAAVLVLAAIAVGLFAPPLLSGRTVSPMNLLAQRAPWHTVIAPEPPPNPALSGIPTSTPERRSSATGRARSSFP